MLQADNVKLKRHNKRRVDKARTVYDLSLGSCVRQKNVSSNLSLKKKTTHQWVDKYWITFSQWNKSSAAAGFEAACGVVRHFKKVLRGPLWGHGKQGHSARPQKDQPAWGHFLSSRLILQLSTSPDPPRQKWNLLSVSTSHLFFFLSFSTAPTFSEALSANRSLYR